MQVILREHNGAIFRRCEPSDLIGVMEINMKTLPEHYSDYFYESLLAETPESFLIAEKGGQHVGYIMCKTEFGFSIFKKLGFVKKGYVVSVEVRCSNTEAVKLYQDLGMYIRQRLKSYYRDGEDAYMMAIEF